ncbi:MAG: LuxR C-terminal-related transcriptional regulator [Streptosporangiaceae bacterium]
MHGKSASPALLRGTGDAWGAGWPSTIAAAKRMILMGINADLTGAARSKGPTGADDPILMSKITVPALPGWVVTRPRVDKLIADGARGPLTTVTGPPGAGKSMTTALWAASASPGAVVWITLDRYDNRPKVFWSYVVAALRRAAITLPRVLSAPTHAAVDHTFLLRLASVLAAQDAPMTMVLDDLHLVTEPAIFDGLAYVLRNAAPGLHLVMSSRRDPLLPLHRYRLAGELTEIRADDLAFSVPESRSLLAHHGITLSPAALECLTGRTEGWAAGVRLTALSLDGHPDPEQFVKELDADDNAITSYLVDEVLNAQPSSTRELLLRTSILDCVSAELAGELAGSQQAASTLTALAQANAFVRPLGHGWFRYHSMFAEVLRLKLRIECPDRLPDLHQRAARWYQRNGCLAEAVRHAAASGSWQFAAGIVLDELAIGQLMDPRGNQSLAGVFRDMPLDLVRTQPHPLLVVAAMELSDDAADQPSATSLAAAESILDDLPADAEIPARLGAAMIRLALSRRTGDLDTATAAAASAAVLLEELPEGLLARHPGIRPQVLAGCGAAELRAGRLDEAVATFKEGAAASAPDGVCERADCLAYLALVDALSGRLSRAVELAEAAAQATQDGSDGLTEHVTPAAYLALASVHLDRNEMQQVHGQLRLTEAALRVSPDKLMSAVACLITARRRLAEGRAQAASDIIGRARQGWSPPGWLEYRLTLLESGACAAVGDIQAAVAAAWRADPASRPHAAAALVRAWLAAGDYQAARLALDTGTEGAAPASEQARLEGWLVDARLSYVTGDGARGRRSLEHALRLGRLEQLRLPFALERTWLQPVLRRDPDLARAYRELLEPGLASLALTGVPAQRALPGEVPLIIEQLTEREHEALQHLSGMLSTAEIAAEMYISVNTVKSHLRSIYRKLSAAHRNEAVRRARQLELIPGSPAKGGT